MLISLFCGCSDFYPRSPCGERPTDMTKRLIEFGFLSTLSLRRATANDAINGCNSDIISIHALLAESDATKSDQGASNQPISIHALLAESDISDKREARESIDFYPRSPCGERLDERCKFSWNNGISIHALLAESDRLPTALRTPHHIFLSTLSLRRATGCEQYYIHAQGISIHALLAESDWKRFPLTCIIRHFYPRSPCGERRFSARSGFCRP